MKLLNNMKKAGIITHYDVHNHGAHLQTYALIQVLKKLGYDAKALQFQKNYDFMGGSRASNKYNISIKSIPVYFKYLVANGLGRTVYNYKKRKILSKFRKNHEIVGDYYSEARDLDVVVIGSDEIFSIEAGPNPWYYGIGIPCKKEISYAASFGPTSMEMLKEHNMCSLVAAGLNNLKHISVRDENSEKIVETLTQVKPRIVCDPVLLFDFPKQIKQSIFNKFKKENKEKYCIVYSYDYNMNDVQTVNSIRKYARDNGLKIYSVGYFHKWCDRNINVDPLDIFKWFGSCEIVFTDTFHGTVISLATGTQFVTKIRENGNKLEYLLKQYGVLDRKVQEFTELIDIVKHDINYSNVNKTIIDIRHKSLMYLEDALGD